MKFIKILIILLIFNSCGNDKEENNEYTPNFKKGNVNIDIPVFRFDKDFYEIHRENYDMKFNQIDSVFPGLIDYYLTQHIGMEYSDDSIQKEYILLFNSFPEVVSYQIKINNHFTNTKEISNKINSSFGIYKYHFPERTIPENIIFVNAFNSYGIDSYMNNLIIGLDFYLGESHPLFDNIYEYLKTRYDENFMVADAMEYWLSSEFIEGDTVMGRGKTRTFLDDLIFKGKIMYLMNEFLRDTEDNIVFRFSKEDLKWCKNNEKNIWDEILNIDLLYKSDESLYISFFSDSPFTKGMPIESPGRLGYWLGFQIVNQYIKNDSVSLLDLMKNTNSQEILLKSKYKP